MTPLRSGCESTGRGGVHQSEDNVVVVETDEEFAYNQKVKKLLEKEEKAGLYIGATWVAIKE